MLKENECYKYDWNGYYAGIVKRQKNPVASKKTGKKMFLMPARSTLIEPPKTKKGEIARFVDGNWITEEIITVYHKDNGSPVMVAKNKFNKEIWIEEPPPESEYRTYYENGKWNENIPDPLEDEHSNIVELLQTQINELHTIIISLEERINELEK